MYHRAPHVIKLDVASRRTVLWLCVLLVASFPLAYWVGAKLVPPMYTFQTFTGEHEGRAHSTKWVGELEEMDRMNEEIALIVELGNRRHAELGFEKSISVDITLTGRRAKPKPGTAEALALQNGKPGEDGGADAAAAAGGWVEVVTDLEHDFVLECPRAQRYCEPIMVLHEPSVEFEAYRAQVVIRGLSVDESRTIAYTFRYVNAHFAVMAVLIKYGCLIVALHMMYRFHRAVVRRAYGVYNNDYRAHMLLLCGLLLFNDPAYVLRLTFGGFIPPLVSLIGQVTFFCACLVYILHSADSLLERLRMINSVYEEEIRVPLLPKLALIAVLWAGMVLVAIIVRLNQLEDPMYRASRDLRGFIMYKLMTLVVITMALLWLSYSCFRTLGELTEIRRSLAVHGQQNNEVQHIRRRFFFFLFCTLLVIALVVAALVMWYTGRAPLPGNTSAEFVAFVVLGNLYCLISANMNMPESYAKLVSYDESDGL